MDELNFDVIVVGAGHAGCEAALAAARMGRRVAVATLNRDRIGHMPCNCSIGGPAKGHLAREVDALGGQMAINTDATLTHIRPVGTGKGPAVQTLRAHADKSLYPLGMRAALEAEPNIQIVQVLVESLLVESEDAVTSIPGQPADVTHRNRVCGIRTADGGMLRSDAVVITTGTFLNGLMHCGETQTIGGRHGEQSAKGLSGALRDLGVRMGRFKTGTTPRIDKKSLDFDAFETHESVVSAPFSFVTDKLAPTRPLLPCWQTHTTPATHDTIRRNLHLSAMYAGRIEGIGPRYCPSIEDKVVRFAEKESHPVFLEQEEWDSDWIYVQGMSTSLPAEVQQEFLETLPGLKNAVMLRPGYAVEYDMVFPDQLTLGLELRNVDNLFLAGQINGTSGYEEAAAQGWLAGVNAAKRSRQEDGLVLSRQESYIGVLVDDLVTKGVDDPYRMLTSRAEYRLLLRHDNADRRLTAIGRECGTVDDSRWSRFQVKKASIDSEVVRLRTLYVTTRDNELLKAGGTAPVGTKTTLWELLRRPDMTYAWINDRWRADESVAWQVAEQLEIQSKYEGYISRQETQVRESVKWESMLIPPELDVRTLASLSMESREKINRIQPRTIGQAMRIPGVTPADVQMLMIMVEQQRRKQVVAAPVA